MFNLPEVSLESFVPSVTLIFRQEMINALGESRTKKQFDGKRLGDIIQRHTNLKVSVNLDNSLSPNAYVIPPKIDKNHPLINEWRRPFAQNVDGLAAIRHAGGPAMGSVDFEAGKVHGAFTTVVSTLYITRGAFERYGNLVLSVEEVVGMIMHEVGHLMTYYGTLGQTYRTAYILDTFVRETLRISTVSSRYALIKAFEDETGVSLSDRRLVAESDNAGVVTTVVLSDIIESSRSQFGTTLYDMRSWESLSDQYAARQGCAADLATALDKLSVLYEPLYYRSTFKYLMVEIAKTLSMLALTTISAVTLNIVGLVVVFTLLSASPHAREYDKPHERLTRLRQELVAQLKTPGLSTQREKSLLSDIATLDTVITNVRPRDSFFEKFWLIISPYTRRQVNMGKEIQQLERHLNNDIFIEAAKLNQLK